MAQIPGLPTLQAVELPRMSPQQAGRPGKAIAGLADEVGGLTELEGHIQAAQGHVDTVAAANQIDAAATQLQIQLEKTQNSRDVPAVLQQGRDTLNEIAKNWAQSPAALQIQMHADSLNPWMQQQGTVRTVKLQKTELDLNLVQLGKNLATPYAQARAVGDEAGEQKALSAYIEAVKGGVATGLYGDAEAADKVRIFREGGQELQIMNAISNPDPKTNQAVYDKMNSDPGAFPDVTPEHLDAFKGHALAAVKSHIETNNFVGVQLALREVPTDVNTFTNPATGLFDEGKALADNAQRMAKGELTEQQANAKAEAFNSHAVQQKVQFKQEADKRKNDIEESLSGPHSNLSAAWQKISSNKDWFDQHGYAEDYGATLRYYHQAESEARAESTAARTENRYEHQIAKQDADDQSKDQLGQVQQFIVGGGLLTKADVYNMSGTGEGKMNTRDVRAAWAQMEARRTQPDFAAAMDYIGSTFGLPKGVDPDVAGASNKKYADTMEVFQQQVNAHPEKDKLQIAHDIVKSTGEQTIKDHADKMFGTGTAAAHWWDTGIGSLLKTDWLGTKGTPKADAPVGPPTRPPGVPTNATWNPQGNSGKGAWQLPQLPQ